MKKRERQETESCRPQFKNQTVYRSRYNKPHDSKVGDGTQTQSTQGGLDSPSCWKSDTDSQQHPLLGQTSVPSPYAWTTSAGLHHTVKFSLNNVLFHWMIHTPSTLLICKRLMSFHSGFLHTLQVVALGMQLPFIKKDKVKRKNQQKSKILAFEKRNILANLEMLGILLTLRRKLS